MKKLIAFFIGAVLAAQTASAAYLTWQVWIESGGVPELDSGNYTAHLIAARSQEYDRFHRGQDSENHENYWFETVGDTTTAYTDGSQTASFGVTADLSNYSSGWYFFIELWAGNHVAYVNSETGTSYAELSNYGLAGSMSVPGAGSDAFQMTTATQVPEPATAGLLLIGLGLAGLRRKVRR